MQIALTWLGQTVVSSFYNFYMSKKPWSQGSLTFTNYSFFINWWQKTTERFQNVTNNCPTTWGKTHFPFLQVFHLHHKQVLTIHTSVLVFDYKQINLRPWAKPVSHTPDTPLSVSSQIFSQVDIHLFCRANNEAYL